MKTTARLPLLLLSGSFCAALGQPRTNTTLSSCLHGPRYTNNAVVLTPQCPASNVVSAANQLLSRAGLKWGNPIEVRWLGKSNRYLVVYPTPRTESGQLGQRAVYVETNGVVWLAPRL
jgi:hypothetical protein